RLRAARRLQCSVIRIWSACGPKWRAGVPAACATRETDSGSSTTEASVYARAARIGFVAEARLEDSGSGLAPVTEGWFVVNVRDAEWFSSETRGVSGPGISSIVPPGRSTPSWGPATGRARS